MSKKAGFAMQKGNPDVLTCIANLSNDEVFTPPEFANRMLDTLTQVWADKNGGASIWADRNVKFLDPFTKTGVFLREITVRLLDGLSEEIPNLQERVNHILSQQVFGIGITSLTAMIARRSLYCSKFATGEHSVASCFNDDSGNIWFEHIEHTWDGNKGKNCSFCGAQRATFNRGEDHESHAYAFIHTENIRERIAEMFGEDMQFDVIVGNPPYQMSGGAGGTSDSSIYHLFVEQAYKLDPRYVCMVIPSRWMAGGRGMDEFRMEMLTNKKLRELVDYQDSKEVFPGVSVEGGICYFLWEKGHNGHAMVKTIRGEEILGPVQRNLGEFDIFVRDPRAIKILHKVLAKSEEPITEILTGDTPFGIATNFTGYKETRRESDVALHLVRKGKRIVGYVPKKKITKNVNLINRWKVLVPEARGKNGIPDQVLGKPLIASPGSICTQTYLVFWVKSKKEAISLQSYINTRFFRFLVSLRKITQHALRSTYSWVPKQSWDRSWSDKNLNTKYGLTKEEVKFIEQMIKSVDLV